MKSIMPTSGGSMSRALWAFRREFAWVGVFSFFSNLLTLAPTLYMLQVFDRVMRSQNEFTLVALTLITLLFFAVMAFAEWVRSRLLVRAGVRFDAYLNARIFQASFQSCLSEGSARSNQALSDLTVLRQFLTGNAVYAVFDLPWAPIYLAVLFLMHPVLGWAALGFTVIQGILALVGQRVTTPRHKASSDSLAQSNVFLNAKLRNAEVVHALGMGGSLRAKWLGLYQVNVARQDDAAATAQRVLAVTKFFQYSQQSLILAVGAVLAIRGELSTGAMVASNALMFNAIRPFSSLAVAWKQYVDARMAYQRLGDLVDEHPPHAGEHMASALQGQVSIRGLTASAAGRTKPILEGISLEFAAGEIVAIVGPSGAGKSTLVRCILGIWPEVRGEVRIDGRPIEDWSRESLGPQLGYLPQDIEMLDGSLAENISRFGPRRPEAVIAAARRTGIHDMILRFPNGYDTQMGEAGALLSGGQRQRIGLARAIFGDPRIVVLDEPNANLDDAGVVALSRAVQELRQAGTTVFMVVHQPNLLTLADKVLVLERGKVTQFGPAPQNRTSS